MLPDGFVVASGMPLLAPVAMPVVEPGGFPVGTPFVTEPVVVPVVPEPVAAEPPAEPPPAAPPPAPCADANVLESASAPANAIVVSFMDRFPCCCWIKGKPTEAIDVPARREVRTRSADDLSPRRIFASVGRLRIFHRFQTRSSTMRMARADLLLI